MGTFSQRHRQRHGGITHTWGWHLRRALYGHLIAIGLTLLGAVLTYYDILRVMPTWPLGQ